MAAALYNIGKLSWNDTLLSSPSDLLITTTAIVSAATRSSASRC